MSAVSPRGIPKEPARTRDTYWEPSHSVMVMCDGIWSLETHEQSGPGEAGSECEMSGHGRVSPEILHLKGDM